MQIPDQQWIKLVSQKAHLESENNMIPGHLWFNGNGLVDQAAKEMAQESICYSNELTVNDSITQNDNQQQITSLEDQHVIIVTTLPR